MNATHRILERQGFLHRAAQLQHRIDVVLNAHGLNENQFLTLHYLALSGDQGVPLTMLSTLVGVTSGAMTKLVDALVDRRVVTRRRTSSDRRLVIGRVTSTGFKLHGDLLEAYLAAFADPEEAKPAECQGPGQHLGPWTRIEGSDQAERCEACGFVSGK